MKRPDPVFRDPPLSAKKAKRQALGFAISNIRYFQNADLAEKWLSYCFTPKSQRWVLLSNSKAGCSSAKTFLFQAEFGGKPNTKSQEGHDINDSLAVHRTQSAGLFRQLTILPKAKSVLKDALRCTTVRNPYARAVSSFRYVCKSHELEKSMFLAERLRMSAIVNFDWEVDCNTEVGFQKFLDYLEHELIHAGPANLDPHFALQVTNIKPSFFDPHLIGRTEDMPAFFKELAERLGYEAPETALNTRVNQTKSSQDTDPLLSNEAKAKIEKIYKPDFEKFGY